MSDVYSVKVEALSQGTFTGIYNLVPTRNEVKIDIDAQTKLSLDARSALKTIVDQVRIWPTRFSMRRIETVRDSNGRKIGRVTFAATRKNILKG